MTCHADTSLNNDNPNALAEHAITLLEQRFQQLGITLLIGAEIEFGFKARAEHAHTVAKALEELPAGKKKLKAMKSVHGYRSAAAQPHPNALGFNDSRHVCLGYREYSKNNFHGLELVITHLPTDEYGAALARNALQTAGIIDAARAHLIRGNSGYLPNQPHPLNSRQRAVREWQTIRALGEVDFSPIHDTQVKSLYSRHMTHGMHLNISLDSSQNPVDLDSCVSALQHVFSENLYLLGSDQASIKRYETRMTTSVQLPEQIRKISSVTGADYIENCLPSCASNSNYAILLQLCGSYVGLTQSYSKSPAEDVPFGLMRGSKLQTRFEKGTLLRDCMNTVESHLGDRFSSAIEKMPPGTEKTAIASLLGQKSSRVR